MSTPKSTPRNKKRKGAYPSDIEIRAVAMVAGGLSMKATGEALGVPPPTVRRWCSNAKVGSVYGGKGRPTLARAQSEAEKQRRQNYQAFDQALTRFAVEAMNMRRNQAIVLGDPELLREIALKKPEQLNEFIAASRAIFSDLQWLMQFEQRVAESEAQKPIDAEFSEEVDGQAIVPELVTEDPE